jgi:site-specific DNA-methyltransferase (adenine-specific)
MSEIVIKLGDNAEILKSYPSGYFDSIVTDAPYGLGKEPDAAKLIADWSANGYHEINGSGFMGKTWDAFVPQPVLWKEVFRVLKPGGHLLCFFGTRTYDWGTLAIRMSGFEIRDMICWHYGSGFPKSLDIGKANDDWTGWGTALKPATEPICVARKPLIGSVSENILAHGTGGINIDACRIEFHGEQDKKSATWGRGTNITGGNYVGAKHSTGRTNIEANDSGRFPANVILDEFAASAMDEQSGILKSGQPIGIRKAKNRIYGDLGQGSAIAGYGDSGGASRFFYVAKPSTAERNNGCEKLIKKIGGMRSETSGQHISRRDGGDPDPVANFHPTVKPIELMRYLIRLVTPKGGTTLDPFAGSGTTGCAAAYEEVNIVLIESDPDYIPIIEARTSYWSKKAERERRVQQLKNSQADLFQAS